jgi:hypothetical protein
MKLRNSYWFISAPAEIIAHFGAAELVRHSDGHHELRRGNPAEHAAAREWYSLFAPEIVFTGQSTALTDAAYVARACRKFFARTNLKTH